MRGNTDTWRDSEGFGRPVEVEARVWSVKGPDNEDHARYCEFIVREGIVPCSCDATRKQYGKDHEGNYTHWFTRWLRWQKARVGNYVTQRPMPWPITGPDGDQWVPGIDFNDEPAPLTYVPPVPSCPTRMMDGRNEIRCWLPAGHAGPCK